VRQKEFTLSLSKGFAHLILLFIIVLAVIGGIVYWNVKKTSENNSIPQQSNTVTPTIDYDIPTTYPTDSSHKVPNPNTVYYGNYEGSEVFFYTNKQESTYYEGGIPQVNLYYGAIVKINGNLNLSTHYDFRKLNNPKAIIENIPLYGLSSPIISSDKYVYVGISLKNDDPDKFIPYRNQILQIDIDKKQSTPVWQQMVDNNTYEGAGGEVIIDNTYNDRYLVLTIYDCTACEGSPVGKIVVNIDTKKEVYKKQISDVKVDLLTNSFSYQKLSAFKEKCDPPEDYGCDNGYRTVMKPSGQVYTEALP